MSTEKITVRRSVFDLDTMDTVTLVKQADFVKPENTSEVLARVGNDASKMLELLTEGLRSYTRNQLAAATDGWHTYKVDAEGEETSEINGEFAGKIANPDTVNTLKLNLAKTLFQYNKNMSADEKRKAKQDALDFIRDNEKIKAGLQKTALKDSE